MLGAERVTPEEKDSRPEPAREARAVHLGQRATLWLPCPAEGTAGALSLRIRLAEAHAVIPQAVRPCKRHAVRVPVRPPDVVRMAVLHPPAAQMVTIGHATNRPIRCGSSAGAAARATREAAVPRSHVLTPPWRGCWRSIRCRLSRRDHWRLASTHEHHVIQEHFERLALTRGASQ